jgi:hypothetical protein
MPFISEYDEYFNGYRARVRKCPTTGMDTASQSAHRPLGERFSFPEHRILARDRGVAR